jgi:hypothetical protein
MVSCIITPINIAFPEFRRNNISFNIFMYCIDFIFLLDLIINFFTAFKDEKGNIVDDLKLIAFKYLTGWFTIDLISILPMDIIVLT